MTQQNAQTATQPAATPVADVAVGTSASSTPPVDPTTGAVSPGGQADSSPPAVNEPSGEEAETARRGAQARIDALTADKWEARRRAAEAEAQLAAVNERLAALDAAAAPPPATDPSVAAHPDRLYTAAEMQQHARSIASQEARQMAFNSEVNTVLAEGQRSHEDFDQSIASLRRFGPLPPQFVASILEAGADGDIKASEIIYALGRDLTEADRLLSLPPERQGAAIVRYAMTKVRQADAAAGAPAAGNALTAAPAAALSSAPPPVRSALSPATSSVPRLDDPNLPTAEWMKLRDAQVASRGQR